MTKTGYVTMTAGMVEVRNIGPESLAAVLEVYRQCEDFLALGPVPVASVQMVRTDLRASQRAGGVFCGVLDGQGTMVGVVDWVPRRRDCEPPVAELSLLMVAARHRRRGIGTAVVAAIEQAIRQDKAVVAITAGVQVNNPGALRFWQELGFCVVSEPKLLDDGTTAVGLRKDLGR